MSFSRPIQWYHSHADPIWPEGTLKLSDFAEDLYGLGISWNTMDKRVDSLKVHKIENFFDSDFGICVISLLVMAKY